MLNVKKLVESINARNFSLISELFKAWNTLMTLKMQEILFWYFVFLTLLRQ